MVLKTIAELLSPGNMWKHKILIFGVLHRKHNTGLQKKRFQFRAAINVIELVQIAYFAYFNLKIKNVDNPWNPNNVCKMCTEFL